ncbi:MAG: 4Fe-4S binding protein [Gemmatimonadetes bacterium]|jgi:NADH-quinone oxidoreductase subunit I|nr:4Fe-4S binding protein [Gemmatimonadota bacterium]MBT5146603.1 4Fe-4S binding protein [Gemmatimonadota bacterium]MBT5587253.1 4Fe-4S binding protein [Gemmatimonadota bacterium]MBT5961333.1 4Fe-4S binding protein [Gemmatimonadota bacterium]MBT6628099.1 4Fe-4S binding protein [Gemmatimonadota bacterium]
MAIWRTLVRLLRPRVRLEPAVARLGRPRLTLNDAGVVRCTACALCAASCPSHCIDIVAGSRLPHDITSGERMAQTFQVDLARCVQCGLCVEACPVDAVRLDGALPAHVSDVQTLRLDLEALKII